MHAIFEINSDDVKSKGNDSITRIDSNIQSLSWMSKSNLLNSNTENSKKSQIYQEGWLATGNSNFMVGCTFTTCLSEQHYDLIKLKDEQKQISQISANKHLKITPTTSSPPGSSTASSSSQNSNNLNRTNFNLRGHKSDIKLVRWNEPYQKLASCDSKGVIYVWVKYEGRWSIELINDRGNCVTDFNWSHDGRQAVICYQDGFVLVGSVSGQRYWSNLYDLSNSVITSATWTPNDAQIVLGLSNGSLMIVDENGTILSRHSVKDEPIQSLAYNSPKFFIHELIEANKHQTVLQTNESTSQHGPNISSQIRLRLPNANNNNFLNSSSSNSLIRSNEPSVNSKLKNKINNYNYVLACSFKSNGLIYLLKSYDNSIDPVIIDTKLEGIKFEWSSCGKILSVGGYEIIKQKDANSKLKSAKVNLKSTEIPKCVNYIKFYSLSGGLIYKIEIPSLNNKDITNKNSIIDKLELKQKQFQQEQQQLSSQTIPQTQTQHNLEFNYLSALTWAHNDQRMFVACSNQLHVLRVYKQIPSLCLFSQLKIKNSLPDRKHVNSFLLPDRLRQQLDYCFSPSLKMSYPKLNQLRKFVCTSLPNSERLHCTLKRMNIKSNHDYYTLYLEYLGGLVPLLSAKKVSKLKPDFVIFDPFLTCKKKTKLNKKSKTTSKEPIKQSENIDSIDQVDKIDFDYLKLNGSCPSSLGSSLSSSLLSICSEPASVSSSSSFEDFIEDINIQVNSKTKLKSKLKKKRKKQLNSAQKRYGFNTNRFSHRVKDNSLEHINDRLPEQLIKKKSEKQKTLNKKFKNNFLVQVKSNFWGTKFKFHGHNYLPNFIGQIVYKTSLFHLQPRQMTITLEDLTFLNKFKFDQKKSLISKNSNQKIPKISANSAQLRHVFSDAASISSISGAVPQNLKSTALLASSCSSIFDQAIDLNLSSRIQILTAQQLIEAALKKSEPSISIVNLPVLKLSQNDSAQVYNDFEDSSKEINCLITSSTNSIVNRSDQEPLISNQKKMIRNDRKNTILNKLNADYFLNYFKKSRKSVNYPYDISNNLKLKLDEDSEQKHFISSNIDNQEYEDVVDDEEEELFNLRNKLRRSKRIGPKNNQFTLHNKPPIWNETSQVYQLDFGGRVTQESAKNFQVEYQGKQVMQFGRIDTNAYTLDFEWPFTTVQAFSIALANITQRLK